MREGSWAVQSGVQDRGESPKGKPGCEPTLRRYGKRKGVEAPK